MCSLLITWAGYPRNVPCVSDVCFPVVIESWLLLTCSYVGLMLRLAGCETLIMACELLFRSWAWNQICFTRVWCLPKSSFGYAYRILVSCCLKLATGYVVSETVAVPGQTVWNYKWYIFWLPLLALGAHRRSNLHTKASFYLHQAWGQVSKSAKAP